MESRLRLKVLSFDYDGCLANGAYALDKINKGIDRILQNNKTLLETICKDIVSNFDEAILFVGSSRQSKFYDDHNAAKALSGYPPFGSCFQMMLDLATEIGKRTVKKTKLDTYLLSDTYASQPAGYAFEKAISKNNHIQHPVYKWDEYKLSVLFAQINKVAAENPEAIIDFDFYDDRSDILNKLKAHLDPIVIPNNVTFNGIQYAGEGDHQLIFTIKGTGKPDLYYADNLLKMAAMAERHKSWQGICDFEPALRAYIAEIKNLSASSTNTNNHFTFWKAKSTTDTTELEAKLSSFTI